MARSLRTAAGGARTCGGFVLALLLVWPLGGTRGEGAGFSDHQYEVAGARIVGGSETGEWHFAIADDFTPNFFRDLSNCERHRIMEVSGSPPTSGVGRFCVS